MNNCNYQTHNHEFLGSVKIAEREEDPHNHRFACVSSEAIPFGGSHFHAVRTDTDFFENHHHTIIDRTSLAIPVGQGKHVHFVRGQTTCDDGHRHEYVFATLIEDPIGD